MTNRQNILIKNIYYMLSYAFQVLKESNYEEVSNESFDNIFDLFASILSKGISQQLKQGLHKEYIVVNNDLPLLRGKIDLKGTIRHKIDRNQLLSCHYDVLSEDNIFNKILKLTANILLKQKNVKKESKISLRKSLMFFNDVEDIHPSSIKWSTIRFHRSNLNYKMLLNICYFVLDGLLISSEKGTYKMASFLDEQKMSSLYEKFVLEYYRYHHPQLNAKSTRLDWNVDDGNISFLPVMKTDIVLTDKEKTLIIDTKYYSKTMQYNQEYDSRTIHSNNMYQIYAYVKNYDIKRTGNVSGMLLYAKTDESVTPDSVFMLDGNKIHVKTLDLNTSFNCMSEQLDNIVISF